MSHIVVRDLLWTAKPQTSRAAFRIMRYPKRERVSCATRSKPSPTTIAMTLEPLVDGCSFCVLLISLAFASMDSLAQSTSTVDLNSSTLAVHGTLPLNNMPFWNSDLIADATNLQSSAKAKGLPSDSVIVSADDHERPATGQQVVAMFQRLACSAEVDLIAVGHPNQQLSHLTPSNKMVYTDYDFVVDQVVKNNAAAPVSPQEHIVVTRLGGVVKVTTAFGPATIEMNIGFYPPLEAGTTYLMFLGYVRASGGYQTGGMNGTLVGMGGQWMMARKAYSTMVVPELSRDGLTANIGTWLGSCSH
jgi:hypothetical protein